MLASLLLSIAAIAAALIAGLYARSAAALAARSAPNALTAGFKALEDRQVAVEAIVEGVQAKARQQRLEVEGVLEAVETALEQTERKRRSAAAAASRAERANGGQPEDPNQMTDSQLRDLARQLGAWD